MKKVKFIKFTMAFFACVLAVTMGSCDKNDDPKVPDLKCTPSKVEVAPGKTATVTVSGGTAPFTVTSSDSKIATAKADKNTITITGVKNGTATILISDSKKLTGKVPVMVKDMASELDFDKKSISVTYGTGHYRPTQFPCKRVYHPHHRKSTKRFSRNPNHHLNSTHFAPWANQLYSDGTVLK